MCATDGLFPEDFNSWEADVIKAELKRPDVVGWYRNPSRASQDSLGVTYENDGEIKIVRPDFIIFARLPDGSIAADIVDPHGTQFGDAIPKLRGLAAYAEKHGHVFRRIDAIAKVGEQYRVLDIKEPSVRAAIESAISIKNLYDSTLAQDYHL